MSGWPIVRDKAWKINTLRLHLQLKQSRFKRLLYQLESDIPWQPFTLNFSSKRRNRMESYQLFQFFGIVFGVSLNEHVQYSMLAGEIDALLWSVIFK